MKRNIIALVLVAFVAASCGNAKKDQAGELNDKKAKLEKLKGEQQKLTEEIAKLQAEITKIDPASAQVNAKLVALTPIQTGAFSHFIELQGKVDAQNISYVAPPNGQGGVVKALYIRQGQTVRKGQVIARLDDELIRQSIEPLRVQLRTAEDTYRRTQNLWDQGIGTYQQVLSAKTQVESIRKQISIYEKQASLMTVTAPNSGTIDLLNLRVGEILSPQQNAQMAQIRIVNTSELKIVTQVPEAYIDRVSVGSALEVVLPDQNNRIINATVNVVGKVIDPVSRTFYIEARIPAGANLKPNQVAVVKIKDYGNTNAVTIPMNTLQNDEAGKYVMVAVTEKGQMIARKRTITAGELYNDRLEVKAGLAAGDQLITEGFQGLYDGQPITTQAK